ncbi:MAG TPA: FecR domain-containing protein [Pyrinomonadaceae bacterium]|nr:FecR domain-containing protein [Pyrinomonadaceae bacterium]
MLLAAAILSMYSMVALAAPQQGQTGPSGDLSVVGEVSVNGQNAISGATVFSGSTVTTAQNSSAVVSLGKLGRVELLPNSSLKLDFSDSGVNAMLDSGRVRVSTPSGVNAVVTTKDGSAVADNAQPNMFLVDVECGNTVVSTQSGLVQLRTGSGSKQVAAGSQDTAGQPAPGTRCTRLTTPGMSGIGGGALAALLLAAGGAIAAAILASQDDNDFNFGDDVIVISPAR